MRLALPDSGSSCCRKTFCILLWYALQVSAAAQDCDTARYRTLIRQADAAAENGQYDMAINKLQSAKVCRPEKETDVNQKILTVFREVNRQRELAIANQLLAQKRSKESKSRELGARALVSFWVENDRTKSLRLAQYAFQYDTNNTEVIQILYNIYFGERYKNTVQRYPLYYNRPGDIWGDFQRLISARRLFSKSERLTGLFTTDPQYDVTYNGYSPYDSIVPGSSYFSKDKRFEITITGDHILKLYYHTDGTRLDMTPALPNPALKMLITPNSQFVKITDADENSYVYRIDPNEELPVLQMIYTGNIAEKIEIHGFNDYYYLWITNPMGPFNNIYGLKSDESILEKSREVNSFIEEFYNYICYENLHTGKKVIERFDFDMEEVVSAPNVPFEFDLLGMEPQTAKIPPPEIGMADMAKRFPQYQFRESDSITAVTDRKQNILISYVNPSADFCRGQFHYAVSPNGRYIALWGDLHTVGEGGAGCPEGSILKIWDNLHKFSYTFPDRFLDKLYSDEGFDGSVYFPDNRHIQTGKYVWMLDTKDILTAYHRRKYWDFDPLEKRRLNIDPQEFIWTSTLGRQ